MATAMNCTVKTYKKVPLVKGGTEVLYLSQGSAEGVLGAFLHKTYTEYYYTRENVGVIQVHDVIQNLEGCNYVSFQNISHGGKLFFGFIDRLVYVNDNNTEIHFTIDPFPTYLGDTKVRQDAYIERNTDKDDIRGQNLQSDYLPDSVKTMFDVSNAVTVHVDTLIGYAIVQNMTAPQIMNSGIKVGRIDNAVIDDIHENGGEILGCYMLPASWIPLGTSGTLNPTFSIGQLQINTFANLGTYRHNKIRSGVYAKLILNTPAGASTFDIENFVDPAAITFQLVGILIPFPAVYVYPMNYMGVANNLAEGILVPLPALPVVSNPVYTKAERHNDAMASMANMIGGALGNLGTMGAIMDSTGRETRSGQHIPLTGGSSIIAGSIGGALSGAMGSAINYNVHRINKNYETPFVSQSSNPCLDVNGNYVFQLTLAHPSSNDLQKVDKYFDYYGYHVGCPLAGGFVVNEDDKSFLQTGSEYLCGSEADDAMNRRLMQGIKIRKTLS